VLLNNEKRITTYKISPITIVDIDSLPKDFYIEIPDTDGLYKWEKDDPVIIDAVSSAIFGEYSSYAKVDSISSYPRDIVTGKTLSSFDNSIDPNAIYEIPCKLRINSNYIIIYGGQPCSGNNISVTIRIKFIINNT
jgi:hypothetical protein